MSNSELVDYTKLSPNNSGRRTHAIDRITPHIVVGQVSVERLGEIFAPKYRKASSNYGIGKDGRVGMYVEECNRSWCSSSNSNDQRAVTIECACSLNPPYELNSVVWDKLVKLCVDICKRNGKKRLVWFDTKAKALGYSQKADEMLLTVHRWFSNTECPGDWLFGFLGMLAKLVTAELTSQPSEQSKPATQERVLYRVQVGAFSDKQNAENLLNKVRAAGFPNAVITLKK